MELSLLRLLFSGKENCSEDQNKICVKYRDDWATYTNIYECCIVSSFYIIKAIKMMWPLWMWLITPVIVGEQP